MVWGFLGSAFFVLLFSVYENVSPSDLVIEYGPFVGVTVGLGFFVFVMMKCAAYDEAIPRRKYIVGVIAWLVASLIVAQITIIYCLPAIINRVAGVSFEAQTLVIRKMWGDSLCEPNLEVANHQTIFGKICCDESAWEEAQKGDIVTVHGVQSILGQSIHKVVKLETSAQQTLATSEAGAEAKKRPSTGRSSSKDPTIDEGLIYAIEGGKYDWVDIRLHQGANANFRDERGSTPLQYAAMKGNIDIVKLLLFYRAKIDLKNEAGSDPFFFACAFGHLPIAELLAKKGAKMDEPNAYGTTPLIVASLTGRTDVVKFLLEKGADINARDKLGNTPLLAAKKKSLRPQPEVVKLLEKRGATE